MGRARGYSAHAATRGDSNRFDAVLGARRGSASAQATRDAQENAHESQVREDEITEIIAELRLLPDSGTLIDRLVTTHRRGGAERGTPEYEKLCMDLTPTKEDELRDLANVAVYGDPEHWPGLTGPAVDTLVAYLHATANSAELNAAAKALRAKETTHAIWRCKISLKSYERLAPVLEALSTLLPHMSPNKGFGWVAARPMAEMLRDAPTKALAGPLQPLVQAFGERIKSGKLHSEEQKPLEQMIANQVLTGQIEEALRPITDVL